MSRTRSRDFDTDDTDFTVTNGIIMNPGKFEQEPSWVPMLWDRVLGGFSDVSVHDGTMAIDAFRLDSNLAALTGLEPSPGRVLCLWSDDNGFVNHMVMTEDELHACEGQDDFVSAVDPDFDGFDFNAGY